MQVKEIKRQIKYKTYIGNFFKIDSRSVALALYLCKIQFTKLIHL